MRTPVAALVLVAALAVPVLAQKQQRQAVGPIVVENFSTLTVTKDTISFSGPKVHIFTKDGVFDAEAPEVVVTYAAAKEIATPTSVQTIRLSGGVSLYHNPDPKAKEDEQRWTRAAAQKVDIDWAERKLAVLTGGVVITSRDPTKFQDVAKLTGDRALISLKRESELKPGEARIRVESQPEKSRIEFTPLPPKQASEQGKSAH